MCCIRADCRHQTSNCLTWISTNLWSRRAYAALTYPWQSLGYCTGPLPGSSTAAGNHAEGTASAAAAAAWHEAPAAAWHEAPAAAWHEASAAAWHEASAAAWHEAPRPRRHTHQERRRAAHPQGCAVACPALPSKTPVHPHQISDLHDPPCRSDASKNGAARSQLKIEPSEDGNDESRPPPDTSAATATQHH